MDGPRFNKEHVPLLDRDGVEHLQKSVLLNALGKLLLADLPLEAVVQKGVGRGVHHIPHFGFAVLVLLRQGIAVAGVDLDGQVLSRVNKLDQDGKIPEPAAVGPQRLASVLLNILGQRLPRVGPVDDDAGAVRVAGEDPGFGQDVLIRLDSILLRQPVSAPDVVLAGRFQL